MCAGFIIHSSERRQDSRHMSGFETARPNLAVGLLITNIALCGIPFLAGFFSKDIIVERMYSRDQGVWLCILSMAGVGATASYSTRLGYKIISKTRKFSPVGANLDFNPTVSNRTLILIAFRAIGGSILISIFYWQIRIMILTDRIKYSTLLIITLTILSSATLFSLREKSVAEDRKFSYWFLRKIWFMPDSSTNLNTKLTLSTSMLYSRTNDYGWLEEYGAQGSAHLLSNTFSKVQKRQTSHAIGVYLIRAFAIISVVRFM